MKTSDSGLALIREFEGCRLTAYLDGAGIPTIGYGHIQGVQMGDTCAQEQVDAWLTEDVAERAEAPVNRLVKVPLTQGQFDSLVSFTFNEGQGHLAESTLLKLINAGSFELAAQEFAKWNIVAGKPSAGLTRRREAEREMFAGI